jgi:hypothetical protein
LGSGTGEGAVTQADKFWDYAREAILAAYEAKTDEDKQGLIELSQTWTRAALVDRRTNAA